jgi:hypothetical protein
MSVATDHPKHGDVWEATRTPFLRAPRFSVMHVCAHHEPPCVTGYWHDHRGELNPNAHGTIPLPRFLASMALVEREQFDNAR